MIKKEWILAVSFFLIAILAVVPCEVQGIGLSPAKVTAEYVEGFSVSIPYAARGNSRSHSSVQVSFEGPLAKYAESDKTLIEVNDGEVATFNVLLKIPSDHGLVGPQNLKVQVAELANQGESGMIIVTTSVAGRVTVFFPYPGQYLDIHSWSINNINQGEKAQYSWSVINRGKEAVNYFSSLKVNNADKEEKLKKDYPEEMILPEETDSEEDWLSTEKFEPGIYNATFSISYGGTIKSAVAVFNIGEEDVDLISYGPENLTPGEINQMSLRIKSAWNTILNGVYAEIAIPESSSITPTAVLMPFGTSELKQYIDVPLRNYTGMIEANITLHFNQNKKNYQIYFNVSKKEEPKPKGINSMTILIIAVVALVILLVVSLVLLLKRKRKEEEGKKEGGNTGV